MRLIDADVLEEVLLTLVNKKRWKKPRQTIILLFTLAAIRHADTVNAMPLRRGKWIRESFEYCRCSVCNTEFDKDFLFFTYRHDWRRPTYCPNCGAKMDGDVENE